jgi:hypothetical protein
VCTGSFAHGTVITLEPRAAAGARFAGWTGACAGKHLCSLSVVGDLRATAAFELADGSGKVPPEQPKMSDLDKDGVFDDADQCPVDAEDKDGVDDGDGCPDDTGGATAGDPGDAVGAGGDRDGDGQTDAVDKCPDDPEDMDSFQDEDGCPDPDNDADGVLDVDDMCPNEPETRNGFQDDDGCPDRR